jgi:hypothetical protein
MFPRLNALNAQVFPTTVSSMDLKNIAKNTAKTLVSYLTYEAVRVVISQLRETNPPLYTWFYRFSSHERIQDGEAYLQDLLKVNQDLAFRVMTVRAHLADEVIDFMPEMTRTTIQQANMGHRKTYLERITQLEVAEPTPSVADAERGETQPDLHDSVIDSEPDLDES